MSGSEAKKRKKSKEKAGQRCLEPARQGGGLRASSVAGGCVYLSMGEVVEGEEEKKKSLELNI